MNLSTVGVWRGVLAVAALGLPLVTALPAQAQGLTWQPCSKIAADWQGDRVSECTTVQVPLDYTHPGGRTIGLAVSRIKATDPKRRQGVLLINPGGPGEQGTVMPGVISEGAMGAAGRDHDLIGFDIRGSYYSDKIVCHELSPDNLPRPPGDDTTKEWSKLATESFGAALRTCAEKDPEFAKSMNTTTNARDMDRIREALGEKRISYLGISWGTALGVTYRSLFDNRVDRMLLDSVHTPGAPFDRSDETVAATEARFHDFAAWIAGYDEVYHFGRTGPEVTRALLDLQEKLGAHPLPDGNRNGGWANFMLKQLSANWASAAKELAGARDGAPPASLAKRKEPLSATGYDLPAQDGEWTFVLNSITCNDSSAARDFDANWSHGLQLKKTYPVAAFYVGGALPCWGWPFPAQSTQLQRGSSALQLVSHSHETKTLPVWANEIQATIGGALLTVQDDVHASFTTLPCAAKGVVFFSTGRTSTGGCPGAPIPAPGS